MSCYQLTCLDFYNYIVPMDAELKVLDDKIGQLIQLCQRLRAQNNDLRQKLAAAEGENKRLREKIEAATARLETLLGKIPESQE